MKQFFQGFLDYDYFSKYNILHSLAHILIGGGLANLLYWIYSDYFMCYFVVIYTAIIVEYIQYWSWKRWADYIGYPSGWLDYQPQDQIIDVLTWAVGCSTVLFWGLA